jgi:hypothetical protein
MDGTVPLCYVYMYICVTLGVFLGGLLRILITYFGSTYGRQYKTRVINDGGNYPGFWITV